MRTAGKAGGSAPEASTCLTLISVLQAVEIAHLARLHVRGTDGAGAACCA